MKCRQKSLLCSLLLAALLCQCSRDENGNSADAPSQAPLTDEERLEQMLEGEEWILSHTQDLKQLSAGLKQLQLPGSDSRALFADTLQWNDLHGAQPSSEPPQMALLSVSQFLPVEDIKTTPVSEGLLWQEPLKNVRSLERAKFYFVSAKARDKHGHVMDTEVGFEGLARLDDGHWRSLTGTQKVTFTQTTVTDWRITEWHQEVLECRESPIRFFEETLESVLADPNDYQRARYSYHEANVTKLFTTGKFTTTDPVYARYQDIESSHQHPGLAVVDVDDDGWDELYVMGRWGKNQLFKRRASDGRYEDVAPALGLDLEGYCNGAIFADFDNDGDPDAFIGRSLKRSLYLENVDGKFIDASTTKVGVPLPFLVSSISAADYNNDGLLDVYLGLYGPTAKETPVATWADEFFPPPMANELKRRAETSHRYLDLLGPPNLLLENKGGRFVVSPSAGVLAEWRNTYQSTWSDFDEDGDVDLYVCNDFAPDALFRNEGGKTFKEISKEVAGSGMMGFGMGASWDDFDQDGRVDLFVSNMFSKAGRRITSQIDGLDERVPYSAQGSLLFKYDGQRFHQVAGLAPHQIHVSKVGWSFGGLFVDADNDSYPDIYSASGYYTAPAATHSDQDL